MVHAKSAAFAAVCAIVLAAPASGDEVRVVKQNGVTYQETLRTERVPVADVRWEDRQETVVKHEYVTEYRDSNRTVFTPVTEYRWEPRWHGLLNPFVQPYVAYHLVPRTRWDTRVETVRTPVSYSRMTPETRTVQVPVRTLGFQERQVILNRVAMDAPGASGGTTETARPSAYVAQRVGGIGALENDPPRRPVAASAAPAPVLLR